MKFSCAHNLLNTIKVKMNYLNADVSVVITCYNHEEFIGRCIRSVINQLHIEKNLMKLLL